ncbi:hypothetical protein K443DRAFT_684747, partial [Laccaria amethystina LaAM-08-1]
MRNVLKSEYTELNQCIQGFDVCTRLEILAYTPGAPYGCVCRCTVERSGTYPSSLFGHVAVKRQSPH